MHFILSMCALILLGSLDSTTVPHQAFHYHLMNQSVHLCDLTLIVSSLLYLQVAFSICESGMYSRIIRLGRKCFVDEKVGAFLLVLV